MENIKITLTDEDLANINGGIKVEKELVINDSLFKMNLGKVISDHTILDGKDEPGLNKPWLVK